MVNSTFNLLTSNGETIVADDRLSIVYGLPIPIIDYEFYDRLSLQ